MEKEQKFPVLAAAQPSPLPRPHAVRFNFSEFFSIHSFSRWRSIVGIASSDPRARAVGAASPSFTQDDFFSSWRLLLSLYIMPPAIFRSSCSCSRAANTVCHHCCLFREGWFTKITVDGHCLRQVVPFAGYAFRVHNDLCIFLDAGAMGQLRATTEEDDLTSQPIGSVSSGPLMLSERLYRQDWFDRVLGA